MYESVAKLPCGEVTVAKLPCGEVTGNPLVLVDSQRGFAWDIEHVYNNRVRQDNRIRMLVLLV